MAPMRFFQKHEFACSCGKCGLGYDDMSGAMLMMLEFARFKAGTPFVINSAIRCPAHNATVRGLEDSAHLRGYAVDISVSTGRTRYLILNGLMQAGFNRIGIYNGFIHADIDPTLPSGVCWYG